MNSKGVAFWEWFLYVFVKNLNKKPWSFWFRFFVRFWNLFFLCRDTGLPGGCQTAQQSAKKTSCKAEGQSGSVFCSHAHVNVYIYMYTYMYLQTHTHTQHTQHTDHTPTEHTPTEHTQHTQATRRNPAHTHTHTHTHTTFTTKPTNACRYTQIHTTTCAYIQIRKEKTFTPTNTYIETHAITLNYMHLNTEACKYMQLQTNTGTLHRYMGS